MGKVYLSGIKIIIGMESVVAKVDKKGRLVIPKRLREELGIVDECYVEVSTKGNKIVLKPVKSIADEYFGVFKVEKWPEDLDEFMTKEVVNKWLRDT